VNRSIYQTLREERVSLITVEACSTSGWFRLILIVCNKTRNSKIAVPNNPRIRDASAVISALFGQSAPSSQTLRRPPTGNGESHFGDPFGCIEIGGNLIVHQRAFSRVRLNRWPQQPQTFLRINDHATAGIRKLRRVGHQKWFRPLEPVAFTFLAPGITTSTETNLQFSAPPASVLRQRLPIFGCPPPA